MNSLMDIILCLFGFMDLSSGLFEGDLKAHGTGVRFTQTQLSKSETKRKKAQCLYLKQSHCERVPVVASKSGMMSLFRF